MLEKLVGKQVRLLCKNKSAAHHGPFADITPKEFLLVGVVVPLGPDDDDTFVALRVRDELNPRMVHSSLIISVNDRKFAHKATNKMRSWQVLSSDGKTHYTVTEYNGIWHCNCIANYKFRRLCRHIQETKEK